MELLSLTNLLAAMKELDVKFFFSLGFVQQSGWADDEAGNLLLYVELPMSELRNIWPDSNLYGLKSDEEDEDLFRDFLETADSSNHKDLVGMEVMIDKEIPTSFVTGVKKVG